MGARRAPQTDRSPRAIEPSPARRTTSARPSAPHGRGGAREGAGRPRKQGSESHRRRPDASPDHPQHVTLRVAKGVWNLRAERSFRPLRRAFGALTQRGFRVVHYSIQGNHVHLVVEVEGHRAFTTGLRALAAHVTHALHRVMGRGGRVLASRTHARALRTPSEVRNVLRYVLRNRTHHVPADVALDPFSTAPFFDDWASLDLQPPPLHAGRARERADAPPRTWLLCGGYRPYRP
ncbi:MAG: hypothetical protein JNL79_09845 [Myxococcales bacterium]|nr:hypothetical protein [Myxococcales bacterium]